MDTWITICTGCKTKGWDTRGVEHSDGMRLADMIEPLADAAQIKTRRVSCTMGCDRACNIIIQGAGKIGYSLGSFEGSSGDADAIVEYASLHAASETGQVPFRTWPVGVKGHFVSRHLPLPTDSDDT
jgi:predicted metal-binding protein